MTDKEKDDLVQIIVEHLKEVSMKEADEILKAAYNELPAVKALWEAFLSTPTWTWRGSDLSPACVYALEMSDGTVKIGVSRNLEKRIKQVARSARLKWRNVYNTDFAPFSFMRGEIERKCHKAFASKRVRGEFFDITFTEACAQLDQHQSEIEKARDYCFKRGLWKPFKPRD